MKPTPDDANIIPGDAEPDAQPWLSEDLERIHEEILNRKRPLPPPDSKSDSVDRADLSAARRVMGMIDNVRRRQQSSTRLRSTPTGSAARMETPWPHIDGTQGRRNESDHDSADRSDQSAGRLSPPIPMQRIGRFEIRRELGKGGCGIVFLADDPQLDRLVAIKIPRPESLATTDGSHRFLREAKAAALLAHPNIVTVYEAGSEGPILYMASEWIDGPTLSRWIEQHPGAVDVRGAARLVAVLADAIQHAHARNVIHRDLKPGNVLLDLSKAGMPPDALTLEQLAPHARVSDFGMARVSGDGRITRTGDIVGTPAYLAPELINSSSEVANPSTDVYGLGTILYELLTGQPPFSGATLAATLRAVETEDPVPPCRMRPGIPKDLDAICLKCLEKSPSRRYASAFELAQDLEAWLGNRPVRARHQTFSERTMRWIARNRAVSVAIGAVLLSVTTGLIVASSQWFRAERALLVVQQERDRAERHLDRAESAIDTMLDDVEETLEPGTQVQGFRKHLLTAALAMQQELMNDQKDDLQFPLRTATALKRAAEINAQIGNTEEALAGFREVTRLLDNTAIQEKDRAEALAFSIGATIRMADLLQSEKRFSEAEKLVLATLQKIGAQPAEDAMESSVMRAELHHALAIAELGHGQIQSARKSLSAAQEAIKRFPLEKDCLPVIRILANIRYSLGEANVEDRNTSATDNFQESIRLNNLYLQFDPDDGQVRANNARSRNHAARTAMILGNPATSAVLYRAACEDARTLVATFPMSQRYHELLLRSLNGLIAVSRQLDREDESLSYLTEAVTLGETVLEKFGESPATLETLSFVYLNYGSTLNEHVKDLAGAETAFRKSVKFAQRLAEKYPDVASHHFLLSEKAGVLSLLLMQQKRFEEAKEFARLAVLESNASRSMRPEDQRFRREVLDQQYHFAAVCVRAGWHDEAIAAGDAIVAVSPQDAALHIMAAKLMSRSATVWKAAAIAVQEPSESDLPEQGPAVQAVLDRYKSLSIGHIRTAIELGYTDASLLVGNNDFEAIQNLTEFRELASVDRLVTSIRTNSGESAAALESMCRLQFNLALALEKERRDTKGAETAYRESLAAGRKLVDLYPDVPEHRLLLADKAGRFGAVLMYQSRLDEAYEVTILAREQSSKALAAKPDDSTYRYNLIDQLYREAAVCVRMSRHDEAIAAAEALAAVSPVDAALQVKASQLMARCSTITASSAEAEILSDEENTPERKKATQAVTDRYETFAIKHLRRGIELGFADVNSLAANQQFESLHDHADFRVLLKMGQ